MWQCRKIYTNLLLLSVLLFSLCAVACPRIAGVFDGQCKLSEASEKNDFRWECHSGRIVYRGQQITAVNAGDTDLIVPEDVREIFTPEIRQYDVSFVLTPELAGALTLHDGRAPPQAG